MRPPVWVALEAVLQHEKLGFAGEAYSPALPCQIISAGIITGWLAPCLGRLFNAETAFKVGNAIGSLSSLCALIYVFFGGVWSNWRAGVPISGWCLFLLILVTLWMMTLCCICCGVAILAPIAFNEPTLVINSRRYVVDEGILSSDQRAYFKSDDFLNR